MREALSPYFPEAMLDRVRRTPAGRRLSLGSLLAGWYYEEAAVTLHDVIVFSNRELAENVWLWAHELGHVQQYDAYGLDGFALRYVTTWNELEASANQRADEVTAAIRRARDASPFEASRP